MSVKYSIVRMSASNIVSPEMIQKYATFGFFRYSYIKELFPDLNCASIIKDIGGFNKSEMLPNGFYMRVSIVNFQAKRRYSFVIRIESLTSLSVGELLDILNKLYNPKVVIEDVFVKFDGYRVS